MNRLAKKMGWGHLVLALAMVCSSTAVWASMSGYTLAYCGGPSKDPVNFNFGSAWTASHSLADWQSTTNCGDHMTYGSQVGNDQNYVEGNSCIWQSYKPAAPRYNWNRYHARLFDVTSPAQAIDSPTHFDYGCTSSASTNDGATFDDGRNHAWSWMISNCTAATQYYLGNTKQFSQACGVVTNGSSGMNWQIN